MRPVPKGSSSLVSSMSVPSTPNWIATEPPSRRDGTMNVRWSYVTSAGHCTCEMATSRRWSEASPAGFQ